MKINIYKIALISLLIIILIFVIEFTNARTIYVGIGTDYSKIQDAIDDASDGDTIFVKSGIYYENIVINKSITLMGEGKEKTVIRYSKEYNTSSKNIIFVNRDRCTIKEIKIIGAGSYSDITGIEINSSNNIISENVLTDNYIGIKANDNTKNNYIYHNKMYENQYGVSLYQSTDNNVSGNNITSCVFYGIYIYNTESNIVFDNDLSDNYYGVKIKASEANIIFKNKIHQNLEGIDLCCGSGYNIIYLNIFDSNNNNANDDLFNQWDNGKVGNYWDDYNGEDLNDDGIGDVPYNITSPENFDHYPLIIIPVNRS